VAGPIGPAGPAGVAGPVGPAGPIGPAGANGTTLAAQQYTCSAQSVASLAPLSFSYSVGFGTSIQTTGSLFSSFLLTQPGIYQLDFRVRFYPPPSLVDLTIEDGVVLQTKADPLDHFNGLDMGAIYNNSRKSRVLVKWTLSDYDYTT
jgi:hypothetical protein